MRHSEKYIHICSVYGACYSQQWITLYMTNNLGFINISRMIELIRNPIWFGSCLSVEYPTTPGLIEIYLPINWSEMVYGYMYAAWRHVYRLWQFIWLGACQNRHTCMLHYLVAITNKPHLIYHMDRMSQSSIESGTIFYIDGITYPCYIVKPVLNLGHG